MRHSDQRFNMEQTVVLVVSTTLVIPIFLLSYAAHNSELVLLAKIAICLMFFSAAFSYIYFEIGVIGDRLVLIGLVSMVLFQLCVFFVVSALHATVPQIIMFAFGLRAIFGVQRRVFSAR